MLHAGKLAFDLGIPQPSVARERFLLGGSDVETLSSGASEDWTNGGGQSFV